MATKPKQVPKISAEANAPASAAASAAPAAEPKKSKKKLIIILLGILILAGGAGGGWFYWTNMHAAQSAQAKKAEPPVFVALETFTVNLQGEDRHLLQTTITLQLANAGDVNRLKDNMPLVKNRLVLLLSNKKPEDISTAEGKNKLAQEIAAQVKIPFSPRDDELKVSNVLFTSFIIQ